MKMILIHSFIHSALPSLFCVKNFSRLDQDRTEALTDERKIIEHISSTEPITLSEEVQLSCGKFGWQNKLAAYTRTHTPHAQNLSMVISTY
mmetsp:Transcript_6857/g.7899  ORF Transcript_6857/g.7899 Transcript_6857/m.7899 type:complete len:91 (+) Transcript_6857:96-368(+)